MAQRTGPGIGGGYYDTRLRGLRTFGEESGPRTDAERFAAQDRGGPGRYIGGEAYTQMGREAERALRGPRYRRSDTRIYEDVCERLIDAHEVEVGDVSVEVRDGMVILEGTVPQRWMKYIVEDEAAACAGVKDVENRLRVSPTE